ncbi:uroporphyrinogen-III synthase [Methylocystis sp. JAN1]|uniref:uroporphyrinogen-III synthase n=1 Tax=Methylocystis sp. JAN1 TaxID=3397211 RepID=UPI003FA2CAB3
MRVLVLRAREDALRTSEKLLAMGFTPIVSPVLEIAATGAAIPPADYDAILVSSAKGVECAGSEAQRYNSLPFHVVGARTARAAEARGWRPDIVAGAAEAILPLLLARYPQPSHFLYLAGRDRQAALETGLGRGGHDVTVVNVYEARAAQTLSDEACAALGAGKVDVALHYSRRSVEIFLKLADAAGLSGALRAIAHFALSADVAAPLEALGLDVTRAEKPDEDRLLTVLARSVS